MTTRLLTSLAALGSAALLGGAFIFQALGYAPCAMCLWQRWPHVVAIGIGLVALLLPSRILAALGGLAALTTAGIGIFHTGVERDWWEGPASCTGSGLDASDPTSLLPGSDSAPHLVMCDQVSWQMLGLSMPSWNAVFSLIFAAIWFTAAVHASQSSARH
ncbi:disulfide bond formation protein B [Pelagovum pacificum]|uniref:Disulfide bond formation protein B n=1 Tax=Pelagovum pacificum TaxID=2588711 RepID=A0A5C5GD63_9RHOB|nr:disulfide bond formation protein B [Pelagovum pacificum]QQA44800.1 disulfide bond formation protein B [Pelagovum pacificum]TNY32094.1 disulfide bond formation protein B [Pelagovum pacificum]